MNKLGTTILSVTLGGALLTGIAVTPAAAQALPARTAATGTASPMLSAASIAQVRTATSGAARAALLRSLPAVRQGSKGGEVLAVQVGLNARGAHLQADGVFGAATRKAVETFQRSHGLVADGIVGSLTWNALVDPHFDAHGVVQNPQVRPGQLWSQALADESGAVWATLTALHGYTTWAPQQSSSNVRYDGAQVAAVKALQVRAGITPSGILGARTARVFTMIVAVIEQFGD